MSQMVYRVWSFSLLKFCVNTGIHRCGAVPEPELSHEYIGHNAREAADTADTSNIHRELVDIDAALLGS